MNRYILASFDVEEFDLPLEYQQDISMQEQFAVGKAGLDKVMPLLEELKTTCTMFTTANFAMQFPEAVKQMAKNHEIASHTFYHTTFENKDLLASRLKLEEICCKPVTGLRMPRMRSVDMQEVKLAGYEYDSSVNPTWIPGRYNNRHLPRTLYTDQNVLRLPASVTPNLRIPLFWLAFKNMPYAWFKMLVLQTLKKDGYVCLYFHPWEFIDIHQYPLPVYIKKGSDQILFDKLRKLFAMLQQEGEFITIQQFLQIKRAL